MLKNLGETLERVVADRPDAPACSFLPDGEQRADGFSFAELDRRARALAGHLHEAGLTGSRVLLVHPPGPEFVVALFACFYAGVTAVPVVPPESRYRAGRARLEGIAAACSPAAQLTTSLTGPALEPAVLTSLDTDVVPAGDASFTPLDVEPESTAILQFTSGATRTPRGVVLSHRSVLANLDLMDDRYERRRGVVTVNWLPLHHDMGLFGGLLRSVVMVGHCVLMPPGAMLRKPIRWWRAVVDHSATVTGGPDFGFDLSVRRTTPEERDSLDLSGLSVVYTGAEPVRAATLERFAAAFAGAGFDRRVFLPVHGLAEATLMVSGARVPDPPTVLSVSVAGDLARPRLGLSVRAYERLAEEVGAVYHSAAKVRWLRPYEDLEEVNVTGTRRVLDLVADGPPKRLVHVSTLAVFPFGGSEPVTEEHPLDHGGLLYGGYPQSKWVAEKLVAAAAGHGLDTVVLRPGSVTGASGSGVFNPRSFVELLLSTVVGLGWAPLPSTGEDVPVDLVPVDYAAAASVALTLSPTGPARGTGAYHLTNAAPLRLSALYDTLDELGYRVRREPFESWRDRLLDPAVVARTPLEPFADFLSAAMEEFLRLPPYSSQRARRDLAGTGVECAPVDAALLRTYFAALHQHGLVPHGPAGVGPREDR